MRGVCVSARVRACASMCMRGVCMHECARACLRVRARGRAGVPMRVLVRTFLFFSGVCCVVWWRAGAARVPI